MDIDRLLTKKMKNVGNLVERDYSNDKVELEFERNFKWNEDHMSKVQSKSVVKIRPLPQTIINDLAPGH